MGRRASSSHSQSRAPQSDRVLGVVLFRESELDALIGVPIHPGVVTAAALAVPHLAEGLNARVEPPMVVEAAPQEAILLEVLDLIPCTKERAMRDSRQRESSVYLRCAAGLRRRIRAAMYAYGGGARTDALQVAAVHRHHGTLCVHALRHALLVIFDVDKLRGGQ